LDILGQKDVDGEQLDKWGPHNLKRSIHAPAKLLLKQISCREAPDSQHQDAEA
jgi:hypothetical protein